MPQTHAPKVTSSASSFGPHQEMPKTQSLFGLCVPSKKSAGDDLLKSFEALRPTIRPRNAAHPEGGAEGDLHVIHITAPNAALHPS